MRRLIEEIRNLPNDVTLHQIVKWFIILIVIITSLNVAKKLLIDYGIGLDYVGKEVKINDRKCTVINFHGKEYTLLCDTMKLRVARSLVEEQ